MINISPRPNFPERAFLLSLSLSPFFLPFHCLYQIKKEPKLLFLKNREIYITDIAGEESYLYHRREEQIPSYLYKRGEGVGKKHIRQRGEGNYSGNYVVNIPSFLSAYEGEIKNLIDYYKPAGRTYVLKIYEYE